MSIKERIENHAGLLVLSLLFTGFLTGFGAYKAILMAANEDTVIHGTYVSSDSISKDYLPKTQVSEEYVAKNQLDAQYIPRNEVYRDFVPKARVTKEYIARAEVQRNYVSVDELDRNYIRKDAIPKNKCAPIPTPEARFNQAKYWSDPGTEKWAIVYANTGVFKGCSGDECNDTPDTRAQKLYAGLIDDDLDKIAQVNSSEGVLVVAYGYQNRMDANMHLANLQEEAAKHQITTQVEVINLRSICPSNSFEMVFGQTYQCQ